MRVNTLDEEAADEFQFQIIESTHKQALPQVIILIIVVPSSVSNL